MAGLVKLKGYFNSMASIKKVIDVVLVKRVTFKEIGTLCFIAIYFFEMDFSWIVMIINGDIYNVLW